MASSRAIEAARAFVKIFVDDTPLKRGLTTLTTRLAGAAKGVAGIAASLGTAAVAGSIGLIVSGMSAAAASVWRFSEAAAGIDDIAQRTGASAEALSQLRYAAEQSGANLEAVEKGMRKLGDVTTQAANGSKSAAAALASVGLSAEHLLAMSVEDRFLAVAQGISQIQDPAAQASVAMDLLGKSGADLVPMMADGAGGIRALMAEADRLGMTISGEQAAAAAAFDDKWQGLVATLRNASNIIAVAVLPYLSQMIDLVMQTWPAIQTLAKVVGETLVASFGQAYDAIGALLQPFAGLGSAVSDTLSSIMGALTAGDVAAAAGVFWASLDVAWAQGIAAISDQWYAWRNGFLDVFGQAVSGVRKMWAETQAWLSSGIVDIIAYLDSSLNADAIKAEIDLMATQQVQQIDQQAMADQQARADAYAARLDKASAELAAARQEWSAAVATAATAASTAANQPDAATTAGKKFDELIGQLKSADIATRVDKAVQQAGPAQDLRTAGGAGVLNRIINQQGTLSQQQLDQLKEIRGIQRQLLKATQDGMIGWAV
ncbi:MAG: hypothetical protein EBV32_00680 [Proteobacteria bacterium]|uniref:Bacteriophage tail tape measure N-terminal domain-containing protein n=1 Tax=Candidatus Fonsibacter lacus TaxID=2576439 RepID=A0A964XRC8_9PROT|nr:hypothetical protein [Candidatus Fonsibacter lacus]